MSTNNRQYDIVNGPTANRLIDAFKYANDKNVHVELKFEVVHGLYGSGERTSIPVKDFNLVSISHEDGSGQSFLLKGECFAALSGDKRMFVHMFFNAYYHARTHNGWIKFSTTRC